MLTTAALRGVVSGICLVALTGCTALTDGAAVRAPMGRDEAIVALLDTGKYPVTAGPPAGAAGNDVEQAASAEAHRMGEYVTGPWQVDATLSQPDYITEAPLALPLNVGVALGYPLAPYRFGTVFADISKAHGFTAGFNTGRVGDASVQRLQHVVIEFPDADASAAAAADMEKVEAPPTVQELTWIPEPRTSSESFDPPWRPGACADYATNPVHADFVVAVRNAQRVAVRSFTVHGRYLFYEFADAAREDKACLAIGETLAAQASSIDRFVPTDQAKMRELPQDPSGQLWARTLRTNDDDVDVNGGIWQPDAWLHFEDNPITAAASLSAAGVDWVSQRLTRVYRARDGQGAVQLAGKLVAETAAMPNVQPAVSGVPGFPGAKCFQRSMEAQPPQSSPVKQAYWQVKCIGLSDRYAFIAYSREETDAKQQISAQYRILAGR